MHLLEDIKESVGFGEEDRRRLRELKPDLEPHFSEIVDQYLDAIEFNGQAKPLLDSGTPEEQLSHAFESWLEKTFTGEIDPSYAEAQRGVGELYHRFDLDPEFMLGVMNVVRTELVRILVEEDIAVPLDEALVSLERVLDLNMSLILDAYWRALVDEKDEVGTNLASSMAHEIRNPLNAVELHLTLLQRRLAETYDAPEEYRPMLESVRAELKRIETLTRDIQKFTKRIRVQKSWYDFEEVVEELKSSHPGLFTAPDIDFVAEIEAGTRVFCDASQLKQVLVQLVQNAVESIEDEGEIRLEVESEKTHTRLTVSDNGEGLESGAPQRMFELFYTTKPSATGLGLPATKRIVEGHDGVIDVRANRAGGTSVDVMLPHPDEDFDARADTQPE